MWTGGIDNQVKVSREVEYGTERELLQTLFIGGEHRPWAVDHCEVLTTPAFTNAVMHENQDVTGKPREIEQSPSRRSFCRKRERDLQ